MRKSRTVGGSRSGDGGVVKMAHLRLAGTFPPILICGTLQCESAASRKASPALHARVLPPRLRRCIGAFGFCNSALAPSVVAGVPIAARLRPDETADAIVSGSALRPPLISFQQSQRPCGR